jgi:ABC-type Fe3+-siderophore transport system permease subunit
MTTAGETARHQSTRTRLRPWTVLIALLLLAVVTVGALLAGAGELGWQRVLGEIFAQLTGGRSPLSDREAAILWQLRAPRVVLAGLVGAALAVSGATFQGVFRNPLAPRQARGWRPPWSSSWPRRGAAGCPWPRSRERSAAWD